MNVMRVLVLSGGRTFITIIDRHDVRLKPVNVQRILFATSIRALLRVIKQQAIEAPGCKVCIGLTLRKLVKTEQVVFLGRTQNV